MGVFEANLQEILRLMIVQVSTIVPNLQEHSRCGSRQANSVQNCPHDRTGSTGHFLPVSRYVFGILFAFIGFFCLHLRPQLEKWYVDKLTCVLVCGCTCDPWVGGTCIACFGPEQLS